MLPAVVRDTVNNGRFILTRRFPVLKASSHLLNGRSSATDLKSYLFSGGVMEICGSDWGHAPTGPPISLQPYSCGYRSVNDSFLLKFFFTVMCVRQVLMAH